MKVRLSGVALVVTTLIPAPAAAETTSLSITPAVSAPRATVTVAGRGFAPNTAGALELAGLRLARVRTDAPGRFRTDVTMPSTPHGRDRGTLAAVVGGRRLAVAFRIAPRPLPDSLSGTAASARRRVTLLYLPAARRAVVVLRGAGFGPGARVKLTLGSSRLLVRASSTGLFSRRVSRRALSAGRHKVSVRSGRSAMRLRFSVGGTSSRAPGVTAAPPPSIAAPPPLLVAAGDIACPGCAHGSTADLVSSLAPNAVATLGDNQYENGTLSEYQSSFDLTWGRFKPLLKPTPGNHEYHTLGAAGYFSYFGGLAGEPARGYYSYDVGDWHVVSLNSNCVAVSCAAGSDQDRWLRADLAAHPVACTLAYMHHPRFSSGMHGGLSHLSSLWDALYSAGADAVLAGHEHSYERFAPQTPGGAADPTRGLRLFVVGTGGGPLRGFQSAEPNSEVRDASTHGVLALRLHPAGYDWRFHPTAGAFADSGSAACH